MGGLSALCLWTTTHLPSPICPKSVDHSKIATTSLLFVLPSLNLFLFHFALLQMGAASPRVCFSRTVRQELQNNLFLSIYVKTNITLTVIISTVDNETCLPDINVHGGGERRKRRGSGDRERKGRSEPNPTISPRVARFQLTTGWFISLRRMIAVFNHFLSLHGFFHSISSSHSYHLTPSLRCLAFLPISVQRRLRFIMFPMQPHSHAVSSVTAWLCM